MGTPINYFIRDDDASDSVICAVLYSNSAHPAVDAEAIFKKVVSEAHGPDGCVRRLLAEQYPSTHAGHRAGEPVFTIDSHPYDHEKVFEVCWRWDAIKERAKPDIIGLPTARVPQPLPDVLDSAVQRLPGPVDLDSDRFNTEIAAIQAMVGQDDGGAASLYFDDRWAARWDRADNAERVAMLREYVAYELKEL